MDNHNGKSRRKRDYDFSRFMQNGNTTIHTQTGWANEEELEPDEDYEEVIDADNEIDYEADDNIEMDYEEVEDDDIEETKVDSHSTWEEFEPEVETQNETSEFMIDGKPFIPKKKPKKTNFTEAHTRYTTYIDRNVLAILRMLQESNQIESIAKCINDSIKEHLMKHYQE